MLILLPIPIVAPIPPLLAARAKPPVEANSIRLLLEVDLESEGEREMAKREVWREREEGLTLTALLLVKEFERGLRPPATAAASSSSSSSRYHRLPVWLGFLARLWLDLILRRPT